MSIDTVSRLVSKSSWASGRRSGRDAEDHPRAAQLSCLCPEERPPRRPRLSVNGRPYVEYRRNETEHAPNSVEATPRVKKLPGLSGCKIPSSLEKLGVRRQDDEQGEGDNGEYRDRAP